MEGRVLYMGRGPISEGCRNVIKIWANEGFYLKELPNEIPEAVVVKTVEQFGLDVLISVQSTKILSSTVLDAVDGNTFNLHNAKLPEYRGFNSIGHAILNGDETYTTTIHWMAPEVDKGDIAYEETFPISPDDTAQSLYRKSIGAAVGNFMKLLQGIETGSVPRRPQEGEGMFYSRRDLNEFREIECILEPVEVDVKSRAFYIPPYEPAYFYLEGRKFYVTPDGAWRAENAERRLEEK